jgi:glutamate racemase
METIQRLGVIGTKKTVLSGVYENRIHALDSSKDVVALPTPLLAPMIEEGYFNDDISSAIIHAYLDYPDFKNIDALVLGCTHYPLIRKQIQEYMGEQVALYDATTLIPEQLKSLLKERGLLRTSASELSDHFYVSDYTVSFENAARIFFGTKIKLEKADIWAL